MGWVVWAAGKAGWYFFAWGPQLLVCLYLGYLCAKKTGGDLLDWLVAAFLASLVPIGGVVIVLAVWWRAGEAARPDPGTGETGGSGSGGSAGGGTGAPS